MKIIDLLNKIANGEEVPEKFKFAGQTFEKQGSYIEDEDGDSIFDSMCTDFSNINGEVEIIEEEKKIPEKLEYIVTDENGEFSINGFTFDYEQKMQIIDTLNQVIDYLQSKGE